MPEAYEILVLLAWAGPGHQCFVNSSQVVVTCSWSLGPLLLGPGWMGRTWRPSKEQPGLGRAHQQPTRTYLQSS